MHKYIIAVVFVASTSTSCLAAQEFYVAQDAKTKNCKVQTQKPDGTTEIMIGTSTYATKEEAKTAEKAAHECAKKDPTKNTKK